MHMPDHGVHYPPLEASVYVHTLQRAYIINHLNKLNRFTRVRARGLLARFRRCPPKNSLSICKGGHEARKQTDERAIGSLKGRLFCPRKTFYLSSFPRESEEMLEERRKREKKRRKREERRKEGRLLHFRLFSDSLSRGTASAPRGTTSTTTTRGNIFFALFFSSHTKQEERKKEQEKA